MRQGIQLLLPPGMSKTAVVLDPLCAARTVYAAAKCRGQSFRNQLGICRLAIPSWGYLSESNCPMSSAFLASARNFPFHVSSFEVTSRWRKTISTISSLRRCPKMQLDLMKGQKRALLDLARAF
jgi:hypothetical protein